MHFWFYLDVITMMNFYLTLPSNTSSQIYSENNPGHYKVKLPRNIFQPENAWEVALASISFPDMVPRVDDFIYEPVPILVRSNIHTKVTNSDGAPIPVRRLINNTWQSAKDKKGATQYWHNAKCNAVVDLQKSDCVVFPTTVRSGYEIWSRFINLVTSQMYQEMKDIYDYGAGYMYNRGRRFEGWKDESGKGKFPHFEWVLNADRYEGKYLFEPLHLQYLPIQKNVFDSVEVGISETDGLQVHFKDGQTILTINFRRSGNGSSEMSI